MKDMVGEIFEVNDEFFHARKARQNWKIRFVGVNLKMQPYRIEERTDVCSNLRYLRTNTKLAKPSLILVDVQFVNGDCTPQLIMQNSIGAFQGRSSIGFDTMECVGVLRLWHTSGKCESYNCTLKHSCESTYSPAFHIFVTQECTVFSSPQFRVPVHVPQYLRKFLPIDVVLFQKGHPCVQ